MLNKLMIYLILGTIFYGGVVATLIAYIRKDAKKNKKYVTIKLHDYGSFVAFLGIIAIMVVTWPISLALYVYRAYLTFAHD